MNIIHVRYLVPILKKAVSEIKNVVERTNRLNLVYDAMYFETVIHISFLNPSDENFCNAINEYNAKEKNLLSLKHEPYSAEADKVINTLISVTNTLCEELQIPKVQILGFGNLNSIEVQLSKAENIATIADELTNFQPQIQETNTHHNEQ